MIESMVVESRRLVLAGLVIGWTLSCADEDETPAECIAVEQARDDEVVCGKYVYAPEDDDPCQDPARAEQCQSIQDGNDEVVQCVLSQAGQEVAFQYRVQSGDLDGQFGAVSTHHVAADGRLWRELHEQEDICWVRTTEAYEQVSLADCSSFDCVTSRVSAAELVVECDRVEMCEGF